MTIKRLAIVLLTLAVLLAVLLIAVAVRAESVCGLWSGLHGLGLHTC